MKEMFHDYKTMVVEPREEFNKLHGKEVKLLNAAIYAVLIGGILVYGNREIIKEKIKSKFKNGNRN